MEGKMSISILQNKVAAAVEVNLKKLMFAGERKRAERNFAFPR